MEIDALNTESEISNSIFDAGYNMMDPKLLHSEAEVIKWYMPVIDALISLGGEATKKDAVKQVLARSNATEEERKRTIKNGASALERTIEFARNDLREEGFIDGSTRGVWKLTPLGKRILITDELAGMIRAKSIRIVAAKRKMRKENNNTIIPVIDLSPYYCYRNSGDDTDQNRTLNLSKVTAEIETAEMIADDLLLDNLKIEMPKENSNEVPKKKTEPIMIQGRLTYLRNRDTAINALSLANFSCEVDSTHPTFLRRNSNYQYTEPHHLVPMAYQDQFDVSLDVTENIVSLCCVCHKQIHYGADAAALITRLYNERKNGLRAMGIDITLEELLGLYR